MYHIFINQTLDHSVSDANIAYANYRAICRKFESKQSDIYLFLDEELLHHKKAGLMLLEDLDNQNTNDVLMLTMQRLDIDNQQLKELINNSELKLSNSRISGWLLPVHNRKFVQMHHDELIVVMSLMFNHKPHH